MSEFATLVEGFGSAEPNNTVEVLEKVSLVLDGETFRTNAEGPAIQLSGLGPEERRQAKREPAKRMLATLLPVGRPVRVSTFDEGAYGLRISRVRNHLGQNVNVIMRMFLKKLSR